jgi:hypothetical protein
MQYLHRHNNVAKIIHQQIAIDKKLLTTYTPYYKCTVTEVLENQRYKLYWDREVRMDIRVLANRPDILLCDKDKNNLIYLILQFYYPITYKTCMYKK